MAGRANYKNLDIKQKLVLIKDREENNLSYQQLATKYGIGVSTVSGIIKSKDKIVDISIDNSNINQFRVRQPRYEQLEEVLLQDYLYAKEAGQVVLINTWLKKRSIEVAVHLGLTDFRASNNWVHSFKRRNNLLTHERVSRKSTSVANTEQQPPLVHNIDQWLEMNLPSYENADSTVTNNSTATPLAPEIEIVLEHEVVAKETSPKVAAPKRAGSSKRSHVESETIDHSKVTTKQAIEAATVLIRHVTMNTRVFDSNSSSFLASITDYLNKLITKSASENKPRGK